MRIGTRRRRWVMPLGVTALAVTVLALLPGLFRDPKVGTLRFADGTSQDILAVTHGTSHRWRRGSLADTAREAVFPNRDVPMGVKPGTVRWNSKAGWFAVWTDSIPFTSSFRRTYLLRDQHGCVFEPYEAPYNSAPLQNLPAWTEPALFDNYPRHPGMIEVGAGDSNGQVAWIPARSPVAETSRTFTADPLPRRAASGGLAVEFKRVSPLAENSAYSNVDFEVRERGTPSKAWRIVRVVAEDATGNLRQKTVPLATPAGRLMIKSLCRREAWKLTADLIPIDPTRKPEQGIRLPRIPLPPRGRTGSYKQVIKVGNTTVRVPKIEWYSLSQEDPRLYRTAMLDITAPSDPVFAVLEPAGGFRRRTIPPDQLADSYQYPLEFVGPIAGWLIRKEPKLMRYYDFQLPPGSGYRDMELRLYYPRTVEVRFHPGVSSTIRATVATGLD